MVPEEKQEAESAPCSLYDDATCCRVVLPDSRECTQGQGKQRRVYQDNKLRKLRRVALPKFNEL
jgi:hypothetical protein